MLRWLVAIRSGTIFFVKNTVGNNIKGKISGPNHRCQEEQGDFFAKYHRLQIASYYKIKDKIKYHITVGNKRKDFFLTEKTVDHKVKKPEIP